MELVPGVDRELRLAHPGHALEGRDHDGVGAAGGRPQGLAQLTELAVAPGEPDQVLRQLVVHPHLRHGLDLAPDRPQGPAPPPHVLLVRVQHPDHGQHQIGVEPPPPRLEAVRDRRPRHRLAPGGVDPFLDRLVREITGPRLQPPQAGGEIVEPVGCRRVGRCLLRHRQRRLPKVNGVSEFVRTSPTPGIDVEHFTRRFDHGGGRRGGRPLSAGDRVGGPVRRADRQDASAVHPPGPS
ncbi:hypothetical protein M1L60_31700 [Actinoplanes sp. TRM 88003]|uniref:Uncharacterized protein n=1 Tax=Paractinoplanes aksuensis TaxID=2939490 RepID=A0ABT1DZ30_9ACTN|nr:hypothetical protein [Actinoplanes aksuensis]MCO8275155.1 hypothetical protein [Actinoplanes aksuensis]